MKSTLTCLSKHTSRERRRTVTDKPIAAKKVSMTNTKQELLNAYNALLKSIEEKKETELRPEKKIQERKEMETVKSAERLSSEGVAQGIMQLKIEIGKMLTRISEQLEQEVGKFRNIQEAIKVKEDELQELYGIEKAASSLAALIEAQNEKRRGFEDEMAEQKEAFREEREKTRTRWEVEKKEHAASIKEMEQEEKKRREREKEEFTYAFKREQQLAKDKFEDEKARLEKEIQDNREQMEKDLKERERIVAENEKELEALRKQVAAFPKEMDTTVAKSVKEAVDSLTKEAKAKDELMQKEFDGQRNVFVTRIESLEKGVREQDEQIEKLSRQLENAYQKVQDIALKAIEGPSIPKTSPGFQSPRGDQGAGRSDEG